MVGLIYVRKGHLADGIGHMEKGPGLPMECQLATRSGTGLRTGGATGKSTGVKVAPRQHG
jgi:hypothetical protein